VRKLVLETIPKMACLVVGLSGVSCILHPYETPLSNSFDGIQMGHSIHVFRNKSTLVIGTQTKDVVLNYRIRGVKGKLNSYYGPITFLLPLEDTVTLVWTNGNNDSIAIPFQINKSLFDKLPITNDTNISIAHPGDVEADYALSVSWCYGPTGCSSPCRDSTGITSKLSTIQTTLAFREEKQFSAPHKDCKLGQVHLGGNSVNTQFGTISRSYTADYHHRAGSNCDNNGGCIVVK
jgi:hypothetical protein